MNILAAGSVMIAFAPPQMRLTSAAIPRKSLGQKAITIVRRGLSNDLLKRQSHPLDGEPLVH